MDPVEKKFHAAMINVYHQGKDRCGYNATRFLQMVNERGGLETAKDLLSKKGASEGLTTLWKFNCLDISMEALVLRAEFESLFTDEERKTARQILSSLGFQEEDRQQTRENDNAESN
ncbi:MAG: hypothetical protein R3E58_01400 [Phycisphaerae bacterium]|nr:hypothetical protein [Phycisphaerales bacterium]